MPNIRIRSFSALSAFEGSSPVRDTCGASPSKHGLGSDREAQPVSGPVSTANVGPEAVVHLRRLPSKAHKALERISWPHVVATRGVSKCIKQRTLAIILAGICLGCVMHALAYWQGVSEATPHPPVSRARISGATMDAEGGMRHIAGRGFISWPGGIWSGALRKSSVRYEEGSDMPLGMPGDSDKLANTTVWDERAWQRQHKNERRISPKDPKWPNSVAICAMMKSEHPDDVVQWIRYHKCAPVFHAHADVYPLPLDCSRINPQHGSGEVMCHTPRSITSHWSSGAHCILQPTQAAHARTDHRAARRWIGVDQIFLKENSAGLPPTLLNRVQPWIDQGFLQLSVLPGPKHPLQNRWYNRCSKPDMAGRHSWVAFVDLDEFIVVLEGCASCSCKCCGLQ